MDVASLSNLGTGAIALYLMWMMYKSAQEARQRNDERLDRRDEHMRNLETDIRNKFSTQLMENTNAMIEYTRASVEHSKVMQVVIELLTKLNKSM